MTSFNLEPWERYRSAYDWYLPPFSFVQTLAYRLQAIWNISRIMNLSFQNKNKLNCSRSVWMFRRISKHASHSPVQYLQILWIRILFKVFFLENFNFKVDLGCQIFFNLTRSADFKRSLLSQFCDLWDRKKNLI